ncbi:MAG: carbon-nitrogen hydrolase family protein [Chromatiales bacterium]|nr:carbon-nitrogen hydrolase family protein [Chromatiales bacterium]
MKARESTYPSFKVALAHVAPVFLDRDATVDRCCALIAEAARNGAGLVAFPEAYVPAFPAWAALDAPINNHEFFLRLAANSVRVPGPEMSAIAEAARRAGVYVSVGLNEGTDASVGCIWNANLLIGEDGAVLNHHRKIVPTFFEKLVWANGDGAGLRVVETAIGRVGALICGENTNPLARYALMAQGEQVHVASYPPIWPTRDPEFGGNYDLARAIRIRAGAHSFEAKCFTVVVSGFMDGRMRGELGRIGRETARILDHTPRGVSMVIGPTGDVVSEVAEADETLIYCDIDVAQCVEPKQFHDVVGYYNRFDIFKLTVNRSANRPVAFEADEEAGPVVSQGPTEPRGERDFEADPQVVGLRNEH